MTSKKKLVIDASVARAAGGDSAEHSTSKSCRDLLAAVLNICHHAVFSQSIEDEWNKHQSIFARKWRSSMMARKKLHLIDVPEDIILRRKVERSDSGTEAMMKDIHLIEAALLSDKRIISLDDAARSNYAETSDRVKEIGGVIWVNPDMHEEEEVIQWLERGTTPDHSRRLDQYHR